MFVFAKLACRFLHAFKPSLLQLFEKIRAQSNVESVRKMSMSAPDPAQFLDKAIVEFTSATCAVLENEGHVRLGIRRYGNMDKEITIG